MTTRGFLTSLLAAAGAVAAPQSAPRSLGGARTDNKQLPRDYTTPPPLRVEPAALDADEVPWQQVEPGMRRKAYTGERLTFAVIEFTRDKPDTAPPVLHYHPHDQVSYVIEGRIRVFIGKKTKELGPGGVYVLPSNARHGIQVLTNKAVLIDVFTPVRDDMIRKS